jgi:hypothetical protein
MLVRKNALNAQPYSSMPPSSATVAGMIVGMANPSKATAVIRPSRPSVSSRWRGDQTEDCVTAAS